MKRKWTAPTCIPAELLQISSKTPIRLFQKLDTSGCPVGSALLKLRLALDEQTPKAIRALFHEINRKSPCASESGEEVLTEKRLIHLLQCQAAFYASIERLLSAVLVDKNPSVKKLRGNQPSIEHLFSCVKCTMANRLRKEDVSKARGER